MKHDDRLGSKTIRVVRNNRGRRERLHGSKETVAPAVFGVALLAARDNSTTDYDKTSRRRFLTDLLKKSAGVVGVAGLSASLIMGSSGCGDDACDCEGVCACHNVGNCECNSVCSCNEVCTCEYVCTSNY